MTMATVRWNAFRHFRSTHYVSERQMNLSRLLILVWAILGVGHAEADWIVVGAAYQCSAKAGTFSLEGTMDTSSPEDPGTIRARPGFTNLSKPETVINCRIGGSHVRARVSLYPPLDHGMCNGIGSVSLNLLTVDGKKIFDRPELFNSGCFNDPVLFTVKVQVRTSGISVKSCRGKWNWGVAYADSKCEEAVVR